MLSSEGTKNYILIAVRYFTSLSSSDRGGVFNGLFNDISALMGTKPVVVGNLSDGINTLIASVL